MNTPENPPKDPNEIVVLKLANGSVVTQQQLTDLGMTKSQYCHENGISLYPDAKGNHVAYAGGKSRGV